MAARNKKKKSSLRQRLLDRFPEIQWPDPRKVMRIATWVIGLGAIIAGWIFGVPRLQARVVGAHAPSEIQVHFLNAPAWMTGDLEAWLSLTVQQNLSIDPLDRNSLAQARLALLKTGCFDTVRQVRRLSGKDLEVDASFLQPFAVVRDRDGEHLIDPHGKLLPSAYRVGTESHFIRIINTTFDRPTGPGQAWNGADITAALHLIRLIDDHDWWFQVQTIDMADIDQIALVTSRDCRILWGASPGEEAIGEVTAEQKINRLSYIDTTYGRIDIDCPHELDITDPLVVTSR